MVAAVTPKRAAVSRSISICAVSPLSVKLVETLLSSGARLQPVQQRRDPGLEGRAACGFEDELVLRAANRRVDGQILHRLQRQRDAAHLSCRVPQARHDVLDAVAALILRLQVDQKAAGIERGVGAVDADEGRQTHDVGILADRVGQLPAAARPWRRRRSWAPPRSCPAECRCPAAGRSPSESRCTAPPSAPRVATASHSTSV